MKKKLILLLSLSLTKVQTMLCFADENQILSNNNLIYDNNTTDNSNTTNSNTINTGEDGGGDKEPQNSDILSAWTDEEMERWRSIVSICCYGENNLSALSTPEKKMEAV